MTEGQIVHRLEQVQKYCRVRKLKECQAVEIAKDVALFLAEAPPGTEVQAGLSARLPSSYGYSAAATYIRGWVTSDGTTTICPARNSGGFGARYAKVSVPAGFRLEGDTVHRSSGAVQELTSTRIVQDEDYEPEPHSEPPVRPEPTPEPVITEEMQTTLFDGGG